MKNNYMNYYQRRKWKFKLALSKAIKEDEKRKSKQKLRFE